MPRGATWWIGLQDAESEHYRALGYNFEQDHELYRRVSKRPSGGRRAASRTPMRPTISRANIRTVWESEAFRAGYARGQQYQEQRRSSAVAARRSQTAYPARTDKTQIAAAAYPARTSLG